MTRLLICVVVALFASPLGDVSGTWNLEMRWGADARPSTAVCTLKESSGELAGKCAEKSRITGEVRDRRLTFKVEVTESEQTGRMTFEGTLDESGTLISGTCLIPDGPSGTFTMKKQ